MEQTNHNPLQQYYRQPKVYIRLPSKGQFYPQGSLDTSTNEEYAVFAMTAKDELMFKTPDALLNGQSTVEVIKSCVPAILDPWQMPVIDVDAVLMAIRIATYGNEMEIGGKCPKCQSESDYLIDLTKYLGEMQNFEYDTFVDADPLKINVKPYTYRDMTKTALKAFEQQRVLGVINNDSLDEGQKVEMFNESFVKLTQFTVDLISQCISSIETPTGTVSDSAMILDFINNAPRDVFDKVSHHINHLKDKMTMPEQQVQCSECSHEYTLQITLDAANFFEARS